MEIETPSENVIRHWVAWSYAAECPEEYIDHDHVRVLQFEKWLAQVKADAFDEGVRAGHSYDFPENPYREATT